jgi:hypothetical protein
MKCSEGRCKYNVTLRRVRLTVVAVEKVYELSRMGACECILDFVIQHAQRMRHIVLCGLSGSIKFSLIISKTDDFLENISNIICFNFMYSF